MTAVLTGHGTAVCDEHVVVPSTRSGEHRAAGLCFDNGIHGLQLRADPSLSHLLDARFTAPTPLVWSDDHSVHVEYPLGSRLVRRARVNTVRLSPRVPWSMDVHGGVELLAADLTGLDVRSFAAHAEAAHVRLTLGEPAGTRVIRLSTVTDVRVERPAAVPVRVEVTGAASDVRLDDWRLDATGGGFAEQTPGYDTARMRYLLVVTGAADRLTICVTGPAALGCRP